MAAGAVAIFHPAPKTDIAAHTTPADSVGGFIYTGGTIHLADLKDRGYARSSPDGSASGPSTAAGWSCRSLRRLGKLPFEFGNPRCQRLHLIPQQKDQRVLLGVAQLVEVRERAHPPVRIGSPVTVSRTFRRSIMRCCPRHTGGLSGDEQILLLAETVYLLSHPLLIPPFCTHPTRNS
jgi:hypothetical protein